MKTYQTAELASLVGVHPNTVRLYEALGLIPRAERRANGYRVFTRRHLEQFRLVRLAFQVEVLQNGLRKQVVQVIKTSAGGDLDGAVTQAEVYLVRLRQERERAEEAVKIVQGSLLDAEEDGGRVRTRAEVSRCLGVSVDTLRGWEMNGLLTVRRRENGYRVYTDGDVRRLKMIRALRCANYSQEAILHLLHRLDRDPKVDVKAALDTPAEDAEIVSVYDRLITSLTGAEENARALIRGLREMKRNV